MSEHEGKGNGTGAPKTPGVVEECILDRKGTRAQALADGSVVLVARSGANTKLWPTDARKLSAFLHKTRELRPFKERGEGERERA